MAKSISPPHRWPSGDRKRRAPQGQVERENVQFVISQPHRRGERSQLAENPMGRFCLTHGLDRALYDAAEAYAQLNRQWLAVAGAPLPDRLGGNDCDVDLEQWKKWGELIAEWGRVMDRAGGFPGKSGVVALLFERPEPSIKIYPENIIAALKALAIHQGRLRPVDNRRDEIDASRKSVDSRD